MQEGSVSAVKEQSVRPWVRYWARYIDILTAGFFFGILLAVLSPSTVDTVSELLLSILGLFLWIFIESVLLSTLGTTLGKWLLRIRLRTIDGNKPNFLKALKRSFAVWFRGLGLGIPIISIFTLIGAYYRLTENGITSWDEEGGFSVTHQRISAFRVAIAVIMLTALILLIIWGES